jgi:CRISPR-associated protein Cmr6
MYQGYKAAYDAAVSENKAQGITKRDSNPALLFERFYPPMEDAKQKQAWLKKFEGRCGDQALLKEAHQQRQAFAHATGASALYFTTEWRFVSGTGNPHPVENGMAWHPTLCVPYLPAAGVKGLAHAFARHWKGWDETKLKRIFGSGADSAANGKPGAGRIEFHDLLPLEPVKLMVDVMTPHYGDWYAKGGSIASSSDHEKIPAPWHNPVPIPFLVVEQAEFMLLLRARAGAHADDVSMVEELLVTALHIAGAGAKTATGYGRMIQNSARAEREANDAAAERQAIADAAATAREKARQAQEEQQRQAEKARQQALPTAEKLAQLLATLQGKASKELAIWLTRKKKCDDELQERGIGMDEFKAALWQDAKLAATIRQWNGKKGDEGEAWQQFSVKKQ